MALWDFLFGVTLVSTIGWVITAWIKAKHGYPLSDGAGNVIRREDGPDGKRRIELLSNENGQLKGQVSRLEERIAVLERIATDPAERTAREIEDLRQGR
jgi:hypothetical protein